MKHPECESEPEAASALFGDKIGLARQFRDDLVERGEELGLIGPRELERLWTRHIVNSALLAPLISGSSLADIGSGAGFPGLVIAMMRPDVHCVLIEPMERRASWLADEAKRLGLANVEVVRARAEDVSKRVSCDAVTARAVSALKTLIPIAVPLCTPGGQLVFLKGQKVADEVIAAKRVIERAPIAHYDVISTGPEWKTEETRVFRATLEPSPGPDS